MAKVPLFTIMLLFCRVRLWQRNRHRHWLKCLRRCLNRTEAWGKPLAHVS